MSEAEKTQRALAALDTMAAIWAAKANIRIGVQAMLKLPDAEARLMAFIQHAHAEGLYEGRTSLETHRPAAWDRLEEENAELRRTLRPFADIAGTNPVNFALVRYTIRDDPERQTLEKSQMQRAFNRAAEVLRTRGVRTTGAAAGVELCGRVSDGKPCQLPKGSRCPDCGPLDPAEAPRGVPP